jgi:hypothetical protein
MVILPVLIVVNPLPAPSKVAVSPLPGLGLPVQFELADHNPLDAPPVQLPLAALTSWEASMVIAAKVKRPQMPKEEPALDASLPFSQALAVARAKRGVSFRLKNGFRVGFMIAWGGKFERHLRIWQATLKCQQRGLINILCTDDKII